MCEQWALCHVRPMSMIKREEKGVLGWPRKLGRLGICPGLIGPACSAVQLWKMQRGGGWKPERKRRKSGATSQETGVVEWQQTRRVAEVQSNLSSGGGGGRKNWSIWRIGGWRKDFEGKAWVAGPSSRAWPRHTTTGQVACNLAGIDQTARPQLAWTGLGRSTGWD